MTDIVGSYFNENNSH